jgi:pimeloyl-ACP methyl ester carboxylesterase
MQALMEPAPSERGLYVEHTVAASKVFGSPGYPTPDAMLRERAGQAFDRDFDPDGIARQMAAIQTSGDRRAALSALTVPTLVIHGADDPLVRVEGGRDTAATIPGAELRVIEGLGHDVPPGLYDVFVDAIAAHTSKAEAAV